MCSDGVLQKLRMLKLPFSWQVASWLTTKLANAALLSFASTNLAAMFVVVVHFTLWPSPHTIDTSLVLLLYYFQTASPLPLIHSFVPTQADTCSRRQISIVEKRKGKQPGQQDASATRLANCQECNPVQQNLHSCRRLKHATNGHSRLAAASSTLIELPKSVVAMQTLVFVVARSC